MQQTTSGNEKRAGAADGNKADGMTKSVGAGKLWVHVEQVDADPPKPMSTMKAMVLVTIILAAVGSILMFGLTTAIRP